MSVLELKIRMDSAACVSLTAQLNSPISLADFFVMSMAANPFPTNFVKQAEVGGQERSRIQTTTEYHRDFVLLQKDRAS